MIQAAGTEIVLVVSSKDVVAASPDVAPSSGATLDTADRQNLVLSKVLNALPHVRECASSCG